MRVLTGGTFDLIHYGHLLHIDKCLELAGWNEDIYVMLVTDEWGEQRKRRPILSFSERETILKYLGITHVLPVSKPEDLAEVVRKVNPEFYVYEYGTNKEAHRLALKVCKELGVHAKNLGKEPINPYGTSTTSMIERIRNG